MKALPSRGVCAAAIAVSLGAVGAALFTQFKLDMQPCPWCVLQRAIFVCIAIAALPGLLAGRGLGAKLSGLLMALLALGGAAAALWQHFVAAATNSCAMTLADRIVRGSGLDELWPDAFSATASCADAAVKLFGVPYEFWSLALFVLLAGAAVLLLRRRR